MARKTTDYIVVHCAATKPSMDIGVKDIDRWHRARGFLCVGYHKVIRRDGSIEDGRAITAAGAHVKGYNHCSVGICLAGGVKEKDGKTPENNFTDEQFTSLKKLLNELRTIYPNAVICGHRDMPNVHKACPSFDVKAWVAENM